MTISVTFSQQSKTGLVLLLLFSTPLFAQPTLVEVAADRGIAECTKAQEGFGSGAAAADFDDDGDVDIFLAMPDGEPDRLYRNLGNGHFEDIAQASGLASLERSRSGLWFDYDADNRLDLLVVTDCFRTNCLNFNTLLHLYRQNEAGTFTETTTAAGLNLTPATRDMHRSGAAAGDLNGDGYLDLVTGFWEGRLYLYLNQRDGTFSEVSVASGFDEVVRGHWQPIIHDFNGDGKLDVYTTVDYSENQLWINQTTTTGGLPVLVNISDSSGCDNNMNDMGVAFGDFDEDGDPDIYATNIYRETLHNVLLQNNSILVGITCSDVSVSAGVEDGGWGWGTTFLDVNNDTYLDLAETNGWHLSGWEQPPRLYLNQPADVGVFVDGAAQAGLTATHWGSALMAVDIDRDGDQDLIETVSSACDRNPLETMPLTIYDNQLELVAEPHNYLLVKPRIHGLNQRAIGAKVEVMFNQRTLTRWITAGTSFLAQEPAEAFFGLANISQVDQLVVTWPDGETSSLSNVQTGQSITVNYTPVIFKDGFGAP